MINERIRVCAEDCMARARAAVDPDVRDRIRPYGCFNNCARNEMSDGHSCPD